MTLQQSTEQFNGYATFDLCYLLIDGVVIPIVHAYYCLPHSPVRQIVFSKPILYYTIEYQCLRKPYSQFAFPIVTSAQNSAS